MIHDPPPSSSFDLLVDAFLIQDGPHYPRKKIRANLSVEITGEGGSRNAEEGEAMFQFHVRREGANYWLSLSELGKGRQPYQLGSTPSDWDLEIDKETRQAMLVWWDANADRLSRHSEAWQLGYDTGVEWDLDLNHWDLGQPEDPKEIATNWFDSNSSDMREFWDEISELDLPEEALSSARVRDARNGFIAGLSVQIQKHRDHYPRPEDVEDLITAAGIQYGVERHGGADWSMPAWGLGSRLLNLYLVEDEDEVKRRREFHRSFSLVHRDMDNDGDDEISELAQGTLAEMLVRAKELLNEDREVLERMNREHP